MKNLQVVTVFLLSCMMPNLANAQGPLSCCDLPGWTYVTVIEIDNANKPARSNYQVLFSINTQAMIAQGKMNPDASDLRFTTIQCGQFLNYWIEEGLNTDSTKVWVLVPSIPAGGVETLYMYYGNSGAAVMSSFPSVFTNVLTITSAQTLNGTHTAEWIEIRAGVIVSTDSALTLDARKIIVAGNINADFTGYDPESGPGAGGNGGGFEGGGGGGYGGTGGSGGGLLGYGGAAYGTANGMDLDRGSGSGGADCYSTASGGGKIILQAASVEVGGMIAARGENGKDCCCGLYAEAAGGGSGGGVMIVADYIEGAGRISVKGGTGGNSNEKEAGGGGRIKFFHVSSNTFDGITNVAGGPHGTGIHGVNGQLTPEDGEPGTVANVDLPDYITFHPERFVRVFPQADFSQNACSPVQFTNVSVISHGAIASHHWVFGNGQTSTEQNPVHDFVTEGIYSVTLITISDSACSDTVSQQISVHFSPVASFAGQNVCLGTAIDFIETSTVRAPSVITSWEWDFGNGQSSVQTNPAHNYATPGSYNAVLTVHTANCADTDTQQVTVYPVPVAAINAADVCLGAPVNFIDASSVAAPFSISSWLWDLGDGQTSVDQHPAAHHYLSAGTYTATLVTGMGNLCFDTTSQQVEVHTAPDAAFSANDACFGSPVTFSDASSVNARSNITSWLWDFGNGQSSVQQNPAHTYTAVGEYPITLIVSTDDNCTDTSTGQVKVLPVPVAAFSATAGVCYGLPVTLVDSSSVAAPSIISAWSWDFGDGQASTQSEPPSRNYLGEGTYTVTLIVVTESNCSDSTQQQVEVYAAPVTGFTAEDVCLGSAVSFNNTTSANGHPFSSAWSFGDGQTSFQQHPVIDYSSVGIYDVMLITTIGNCSDTIMQSVQVFPSLSVTLTSTDVLCAGANTASVDVSVTGGTADFTYAWSNQATTQNLRNVSGGVYHVTVTDVNNCAATGSAVVSEPASGIAAEAIIEHITCFGWEDGAIEVEVSGGTGQYEYAWSNNNTTTSNPALPAGDYTVTITDAHGCTFTETFTVTEPELFTLTVLPQDTTTFFGSPLRFTSTISPPGSAGIRYSWDPPADLSCNNCPDPLLVPAEDSVVFHITAENANGCLSYDTVIVRAEDKVLYIPNAFTPNGDGVNDVFTVFTYGDKRVRLRIFDRWGSLIFTSDDKRHGWDGTAHGQQVNPGVFVYEVFVEYLDNTTEREKGSVTVIK